MSAVVVSGDEMKDRSRQHVLSVDKSTNGRQNVTGTSRANEQNALRESVSASANANDRRIRDSGDV